MIRLVFLWMVAAFNMLYLVLVADSTVQEYFLDKFIYWGYPQWGWMYSSPKLYIWFNSIYFVFLVVFMVFAVMALLKKNRGVASLFLGIPLLSALIFMYMPNYNWDKQFAVYNAEKTTENSRIPEGKWWVSAKKMDKYDDQGAWGKLKGTFGRGEWPGGYALWGEYRIWLRADMITNTKDRRGLVFHGGTKKASPWGIDMGKDIIDFAKRLEEVGKPLDIVVSYNNDEKKAAE